MSPPTTTLHSASVRSLASRRTVGSVFTRWLHRTCPLSSSPRRPHSRQPAPTHLLHCHPHRPRALDPHRDPAHPVRWSSVSIFPRFYRRHPNTAETVPIPLRTWVRCAGHHRRLLCPSPTTPGLLASRDPAPALSSHPSTPRLPFRSSFRPRIRTRTRTRTRTRAPCPCPPSTPTTALPYAPRRLNKTRGRMRPWCSTVRRNRRPLHCVKTQ